MLAVREHSAKELFNKLCSREFDESSVAKVIDELAREGLQSDDRFTEIYIHSRIEKGFGPIRIRMELRERGVIEELISHHLDDSTIDWRSHLKRVREKKFGETLPDDYRDRVKQSRFLQQRGFDNSLIRKIMKAGDDC